MTPKTRQKPYACPDESPYCASRSRPGRYTVADVLELALWNDGDRCRALALRGPRPSRSSPLACHGTPYGSAIIDGCFRRPTARDLPRLRLCAIA
jgi:hypothetical protein